MKDELMLELPTTNPPFHVSSTLLPLFLILAVSCNTPSSTEPVQALPDVRFTDISTSSGLSFKHSNGKSGRYYFIETVASGGGFIDYDGDGDLDIYLLNGSAIPGFEPDDPLSSALYRNNGNGTFTDVTGQAEVGNEGGYGMGLAVADYDNDGDDDLFRTNFGENVLYRNNGDGTFTDVTARARLITPRNPMFSTSAAFLDYDRDGHLDLFVCGYVDFTFDSNKRCVRDDIRSYCDPDVYNGVPDLLYHNNGDGTFTDEALLAGVAYGEDGVARAGMGADFGDFDHNGTPDLYVTNFSLEPNSLFRNNANGTFTETTFGAGVGNPTLTFLAFGTAFFDYDNDGWLDLFAANGHVIDNIEAFDQSVTYAETNQVFRNNKDGRFTDISARLGASFQVKRVHRGAAFGDVDNDGDIDVLVTSVNGVPELLRNDGGNTQHSLLIGTVGNRSNRNGIGACITVVAGDMRQRREVRSAYSFMSSNDLRVHFGLGEYAAADSVIVDWPSGVQDRLSDINAGQWITIEEGEGVVSQTSLPAH
ncbi:MAG: CRTAC1 family protein [Candidatus Latescibacteria bacterium]|nr:CRTAC1 family protein [Candidatus Latescibacterota bacterium]